MNGKSRSERRESQNEKARVVPPGFVIFSRTRKLFSVATTGIVFTMHDSRLCFGGMGHFVYPAGDEKKSSPLYARSSILGLIQILLKEGAKIEDLSVTLHGGSCLKEMPLRFETLAKENILEAQKVVESLKVVITSRDFGGCRGRKIIFSPQSGEVVVAHMNHVRTDDWYVSDSFQHKQGEK